MNSSSYFLGANTPYGFYSLFSELYNPYDEWKMYIIKGGPGTGKSTLMKAVAEEAEKRNISVNRIPCSSDPLSLDGVIIPTIKVSIADGTSPHVVEPIFPGVCEQIVNLSVCWDTNKLKEDSSKIKIISMTNSSAHKKCIKYMKTAKLINEEINKYIEPAINYEKIERYTERLKELDYDSKGECVAKNRFLSALTPLGIVIKYDTFINSCDKIITIKDNYNVSHYIIDFILNRYNKNVIKYNCPMNPEHKTEHLVFPDIGLGIFTSNTYHPMINKTYKTVNTDRFIDKDKIEKHKNSISFLKKTKMEMLKEAVVSLQAAKSAHDILESYYINAMDFDKVKKIKDNVIEDIFK